MVKINEVAKDVQGNNENPAEDNNDDHLSGIRTVAQQGSKCEDLWGDSDVGPELPYDAPINQPTPQEKNRQEEIDKVKELRRRNSWL